MSRFDIVHSDAGWFTRYIAGNGKEVWRTSETYGRKRGAENAVETITGCYIQWVEGKAVVWVRSIALEVRYSDERVMTPTVRPSLPEPEWRT